MKYEACELLATHLRGDMGINVLRLSVPLQPLDPPLEEVTVRSEFDLAGWMPGRPIPALAYGNGPLCLVRGGEEASNYSAAGNPEIADDATMLSLAAYLFFPRREIRQLPEENRMLSALLRVLRRSIGHFMEDVPITDRNLRDVQLTALLGPIRLVPMVTAVSELDVLAGAVFFDCKVNDRWAEGITT